MVFNISIYYIHINFDFDEPTCEYINVNIIYWYIKNQNLIDQVGSSYNKERRRAS